MGTSTSIDIDAAHLRLVSHLGLGLPLRAVAVTVTYAATG